MVISREGVREVELKAPRATVSAVRVGNLAQYMWQSSPSSDWAAGMFTVQRCPCPRS